MLTLKVVLVVTRYVRHVIMSKQSLSDLQNEIDNERECCNTKPHFEKNLLEASLFELAKHLNFKSMSWNELININFEYLQLLGDDQQVEKNC